MVIAAVKLKDTPWEESYDQPRQHIKKQRHYFTNTSPSSQGYMDLYINKNYIQRYIHKDKTIYLCI